MHELSERIELTKRQSRLDWYEKEIEKRGRALSNIFKELRDDPLKPYLAICPTFDEYCQTRWNMTERRVQQIMAAESLREIMIGLAPEMEAQIKVLPERPLRELSGVPPENQVEVLREAAKNVKGPTTAAMKRAKSVILAVDAENTDPDAPVKLSVEFRPSEWTAIADVLDSTELVALGAVIRGGIERVAGKKEAELL